MAGSYAPNGNRYIPQLTTQGTTDYAQIVVNETTTDAWMQAVEVWEAATDVWMAKRAMYGDTGYTTLAEALTTIGATQMSLEFPSVTGAVAVAVNTSIPSNVQLIIRKGAYFSVPNGVTLTIDGTITTEPDQIFSCTGTGKVEFGLTSPNRQCIYTEWWGAKGDYSTDCTAAFDLALLALPEQAGTWDVDYFGTIQLLPGKYVTTGDHFIPVWYSLKGAGRFKTQIYHTGANICFTSLCVVAGEYILYHRPEIKDFFLSGTAGGTGGLMIGGLNSGWDIDIDVFNYTAGFGITLYNQIGFHSESNRIKLNTRACLYGINLDNEVGGSNHSFGYQEWDLRIAMDTGPNGARAINFQNASWFMDLYNSTIVLRMWMTGTDLCGISLANNCWMHNNKLDMFLDYASVYDGSDCQYVRFASSTNCKFFMNEGKSFTPPYGDAPTVYNAIIKPLEYGSMDSIKVKGYAVYKEGTINSGDVYTYESGKMPPNHQFKIVVHAQSDDGTYRETVEYKVTNITEDVISGVESISGGSFGTSRITVQPKGGAVDYSGSAGNGCAFDVVITADAPSETPLTYSILIEAVY